jgi:lysophospholipase L1-like esterase
MTMDTIARGLALQATNGAAAFAVAAENSAITAASAAAAANSASGVASASAATVTGIYPNAYSLNLPNGATALSSAGIGTGSAGTPGTYAGGVSGGPTGFAWTYTIDGTGKIANYAITNPGLSTDTMAPTLSYPSGSVTGATVPVATVASLVADQKTYWVVAADGSQLLLYGNNGGAVAKAPFGGVQASIATGASNSIQAAANTIAASTDANGAYATREMADGSFRVQDLRDGAGRVITSLIDTNTAAIAAIQSKLGLLPPLQILRAQKSLYNAGGGSIARQIMASDPVTVSAPSTTASLSGVVIAKDDSRVRFIGGRRAAGTTYPSTIMMADQSTTYNASPSWTIGINAGFEFVLPATVNSFEWYTVGTGSPGNWAIEINGVATSDAGYASAPTNGSLYYHRVDLPTSAIARRIRIWTPNRKFGGLNLPAGATLNDPTPAVALNAVFIGDSITEGSVSTAVWRAWAMQCAYRLGIDNPIVSGVGGSGYLNSLGRNGSAQRVSGFNDYNFRERINDVLQAVNGGPPDVVVIAGGINDGAFYTPAQIQAEALAYFQALRAAAPDMIIIVSGPWAPYGGYGAAGSVYYTTRDAIFAAAQQVRGVETVDVSGFVTTANQDTIFNGTVNGPHPVDAGHAIYGQLAAAAIAPIINSL